MGGAVWRVYSVASRHGKRSADPASRMNEQISFMKNMALLGADLMFLMIEEPWVLGAIL